MNTKNILYALTCISFSMVLGAGIYEHVAIWPSAFSEPPRSLTMFQGAYKLNAAPFWQSIHPVTMVLFITTLALNWRTPRRRYVLIPLIAYVVILAITFAFFVPTLLQITGTTYSDTVREDLQDLGRLWVNLSLARAAVLLICAAMLMVGMTKSEENTKHPD
jgi:hypothetical protein